MQNFDRFNIEIREGSDHVEEAGRSFYQHNAQRRVGKVLEEEWRKMRMKLNGRATQTNSKTHSDNLGC
jgi:hypothetical protein